MRRREWLALWVLGVAILAGAAAFIPQPAYMDAYYYFGGALRLARGQGFSEPYLWNYLAPGRDLPAPSHLYWMPLTSIVAAPFLAFAEWAVGGALSNAVLFRWAQAPQVLAAAGLAVLAGWVSAQTTGLRRHAWAAGLITLFSAFYFPFWLTTDSFALFGLAAAGALVFGVRALAAFQPPASAASLPPGAGRVGQDLDPGPRQGDVNASGTDAFPSGSLSGTDLNANLVLRSRRDLFAAGLLAGLAHLARADGLLVLLCLLIFLTLKFWRAHRRERAQGYPSIASRPQPVSHWALVIRHFTFLFLGYLLPTLPWFLRNLAVVGAPLAPGGARALWLISYADLFTYMPESLTLERYLAAGWGAIALGKWEALAANLQSLVAVQANIVAFPFALIGAWRLRRQPLFQAAGLYGAGLFLAMTLAFTWPGMLGGYFHSGAALLPFVGPAALVGVDAAVAAAARRLKHWQPEKSKPVFGGLLVAAVVGLAALRFPAAAAAARGTDAVYAEIGAWLRTGDPQAAGAACCPVVVAVNNPPAFTYHTGLAAIVVPADGPGSLLQAMRAFGARWLVLDANVTPALARLYDDPQADPHLRLHATFQDSAGRPVYLLEMVPIPDP